MVRSKKQAFIIIGIFTLILSLTTLTYAFFNYTRTGSANILRTGSITFSSNEGNTLSVTNLFPLTSTEAESANLESATVSLTGSTTYSDGEEFEITLTNVNNKINGKEIPLNYIATYTANTGGSIGTSSNDYYNARDSKNATIYKFTNTGKVEEGKQVLVGYIDNDGTGINGTLTIKAYIDADRIAISDSYPSGDVDFDNNGEVDYTNGTTSSWVNGRTVLTTSEWNSLQNTQTPISFQIKVVSNEGIWTEENINDGTIDSCEGCKFIYTTTSINSTWNMVGWDDVNQVHIPETPTVLNSAELSDSYLDVVNASGKNYFLGVKLNSSNQATNIYACGVKDNVPFCIEGTSDGSKNATNQTLLQSAELYNNTCTINSQEGQMLCGPWDGLGAISAYTFSSGRSDVGVGINARCVVYVTGDASCYYN